ncbi:hypothetical protein EVAR_73714_1 [Eumeta japonica]|uniref:Uncharacterized protein n=1 Tax=Eumeta variegata TaxID=151549 RepID=A0A4C1TDE0_EUMVA|nr:hypothetical protein EVAR_73714_1 [Eumeta japonica]
MKKERKKPPRKTTDREDKAIVKESKLDPFKSSRTIMNEINEEYGLKDRRKHGQVFLPQYIKKRRGSKNIGKISEELDLCRKIFNPKLARRNSDLHPTENLWNDVKMKVGQKRYKNSDELWEGVKEAWNYPWSDAKS